MAELNTEDAINRLYLYETQGLYGDTLVELSEIKAYVDYITKVREVKTSEAEEEETLAPSVLQFLKNYKAIRPVDIAKANGSSVDGSSEKSAQKLTIKAFYHALEKVMNHQTITPDEALFFLEEKNTAVNTDNIWSLLGLSGTLLTECDLPFNVVDSIFKSKYRIGKVYALEKSKDLSGYQRTVYAAHGTRNDNVLSILCNGFISSSQVSGVVQSGQMFGQGVYSCRPSQISKVLNYLSKPSATTPSYAFLLKLGYDKKIDVTNARYDKIRPGELVHAHKIGMYARDEYVVPDGAQIAVTHLIEIFRK
jgi:hypothetical protein